MFVGSFDRDTVVHHHSRYYFGTDLGCHHHRLERNYLRHSVHLDRTDDHCGIQGSGSRHRSQLGIAHFDKRIRYHIADCYGSVLLRLRHLDTAHAGTLDPHHNLQPGDIDREVVAVHSVHFGIVNHHRNRCYPDNFRQYSR